MSNVKDIVLRVIPSKVAIPFVRAHHYSGKVVHNSNLHFGCFLDGGLHGVISFGPSMDKSRMMGLVETGNEARDKWSEFLELNRMAFDDYLPANSESRCLGIAFRMIRKYAPQIKYVISFSDATASGDGTIYRASGFKLTQIKRNKSILQFKDGERVATLSITNDFSTKVRLCKQYGIPVWSGASVTPFIRAGVAECAEGFQLRYIKLLTPDCKLLVPELPFSAIDEAGAGMWRGQRITRAERHLKTKEKKV